jgi:NADPH-dependent ferric siderophore reductase
LTNWSLELIRIESLTPWYRRLVFADDGLAKRINLGPGGFLIFKLTDQQGRPVKRSYSLAAIRPGLAGERSEPASSELVIDACLHQPVGPGSTWAAAAQVGDQVLVEQPIYHWQAPAPGPSLLIADAAALGAAGSIAAALAGSSNQQPHWIGVDQRPDRASIIPALSQSGVIDWVDAISPEQLRAWTADWPAQGAYLWAAGSASLVKTVRQFCRQQPAWSRNNWFAQTYWV